MELSQQETLCQYLKDEGYPIANTYDGGEVLFRCEGNHYLAKFHPYFQERFALALPAFWELDDAEEEGRALAAANKVNQRYFGTTVVCADQSVTAFAALFLANPAQDLKKVFNIALKGLQLAANTFVSLMLQEEPPDTRSNGSGAVPPPSNNGTPVGNYL
jgi:hypothetical protein